MSHYEFIPKIIIAASWILSSCSGTLAFFSINHVSFSCSFICSYDIKTEETHCICMCSERIYQNPLCKLASQLEHFHGQI